MPKMQVNDDGTVTIPLRGGNAVTLDEPSMEDLAWLTEEAERVDNSLPTMPNVTDRNDVEQMTAWREASAARTLAIYGGEMPYGKLMVELIGRTALEATPEQPMIVDPKALYGWAASPGVIRELLEMWRAPLPGAESRQSQ